MLPRAARRDKLDCWSRRGPPPSTRRPRLRRSLTESTVLGLHLAEVALVARRGVERRLSAPLHLRQLPTGVDAQ